MLAQHAIDRVAISRALLQAFDALLSTPQRLPLEQLYEEWLSFAEPIGTRVSLRHKGIDYSGRTVSIDPGGGLEVQCDDGVRRWFDPMHTSLL
jgi:biotin-(acetyl-CoA carboxylase) ligase